MILLKEPYFSHMRNDHGNQELVSNFKIKNYLRKNIKPKKKSIKSDLKTISFFYLLADMYTLLVRI